MAHFLRDQHVRNLWVEADTFDELSRALAAAAGTMPVTNDQNGQPQQPHLTYIIRFDNKGYRVFSLTDLLSHFRIARYVERVILTLESSEALRTNRAIGSYAEIRLDHKEEKNCYVSVSSDNGQWVDATYGAIHDILAKQKTFNGLFRGAWMQLIAQLVGVAAGFAISVWGASTIAPYLQVENAFLIAFLLALLIFSNLWTYLNRQLVTGMWRLFPNLDFRRPSKWKYLWLGQTIVGSIVVAVVFYLLNIAFTYIGKVLGQALGFGT